MRVIYICMTSMHDKLTMKYWYPYMWCVSLQQCNKSPLIWHEIWRKRRMWRCYRLVDAVGPRVHCHIHDAEFLLQDFPSRWLRGRWKKRLRFQTRNEKVSKTEEPLKLALFFFRPVRCASYFRVFFLWARSMEVLLCAPFAGGLCDVWIVSFLHFEFDFVSFYLSAFAVSGFCQSWRIGRIGHFFRRKTRRMRPSGESHGCSISLLLLGFRSRQYSRGTEVFLAILYISHESCI